MCKGAQGAGQGPLANGGLGAPEHRDASAEQCVPAPPPPACTTHPPAATPSFHPAALAPARSLRFRAPSSVQRRGNTTGSDTE